MAEIQEEVSKNGIATADIEVEQEGIAKMG